MIEGFELTEEFIQFYDEIDTWEDAIRYSSDPLLQKGYVRQSYIDGMIESVKEHGPYVVIAPNIALPHARPETGSVKVGYSIMKVEKPVSFTPDGNNDATFFIALSCVDATTHLEMLQRIVTVLSDQEKHDAIFEAKTKKEMIEIFNN
ncbi:PTS sugar transporter subunit IIA [Anaerotalea alkaliphila]|uniref:Ascorbate-specific PTS system EIIA component n=1 Tax=Anaerotalea alkaliphila TaxID=2662126 RepID=A0A7X5HVS3_9FIRM|nr:PTS sugar transporter subunit IIA [Anaerotalea alkaliphila]NDL67555.1 PTS sugar transporter subunit IIA [Anaerotalea alkaliphila]